MDGMSRQYKGYHSILYISASDMHSSPVLVWTVKGNHSILLDTGCGVAMCRLIRYSVFNG